MEILKRYIKRIRDESGPLHLDVSPLMMHDDGFEHLITCLDVSTPVKRAAGSEEPRYAIASIETSGAGLGPLIAYRLRKPCIIVRRGFHHYNKDRLEWEEYEHNGKKKVLSVPKWVFDKYNGDIVLIDDVLATGTTAIVSSRLLKRGRCNVVRMCFVASLQRYKGKKHLREHGHNNVSALAKYDE